MFEGKGEVLLKERKYWRKIKEYRCRSCKIFSIGEYFEFIFAKKEKKGRNK